jgi:hypothetical protein
LEGILAYSDFNLKKVKLDFQIQTIENLGLFDQIQPIEISDYLQKTLKRNVPLALAINTEKARSELIVINILLELKDILANRISLFSGIDFTVDREKGLAGFCDYIISGSAEQLYLDLPVITIVEAKNENITAGLGQCIAEMYGAQLFNQAGNQDLSYIYGAVTTGDEWRFVKLQGQVAYIDHKLYYITEIGKIIAILVKMVHQEA